MVLLGVGIDTQVLDLASRTMAGLWGMQRHKNEDLTERPHGQSWT